MSVNRGMLAAVCVWGAGALLDEQWADLGPSETLLIKAGSVCNLSSLACRLCSLPSRKCLLPRLNALSLLVFPTSLSLRVRSCRPAPTSLPRRLSFACSADAFRARGRQIAARGCQSNISPSRSSERWLWFTALCLWRPENSHPLITWPQMDWVWYRFPSNLLVEQNCAYFQYFVVGSN